jgi:hypothetical protein
MININFTYDNRQRRCLHFTGSLVNEHSKTIKHESTDYNSVKIQDKLQAK